MKRILIFPGLEKIAGTLDTIGSSIRQHILDTTDLTASVGIGPNRLIAKLGSEACKPDGLLVIQPDEVMNFLAPMPVSNLRGLGKKTQKIFDRLQINTVEQLRATPLTLLEQHLGEKAALGFHRQAHGIASDTVTTDRQRKSISKERTFGKDVRDHQLLHDELRQLATQVAHTARREQLAGRVVTLKIRYQGFSTHTRQSTLPEATADERILLATASSLLTNGNLPDKPVRLIGIGISGWDQNAVTQTDLFAPAGQDKNQKKILETIDAVTEKFGKPMLGVGLSQKSEGSSDHD